MAIKTFQYEQQARDIVARAFRDGMANYNDLFPEGMRCERARSEFICAFAGMMVETIWMLSRRDDDDDDNLEEWE